MRTWRLQENCLVRARGSSSPLAVGDVCYTWWPSIKDFSINSRDTLEQELRCGPFQELLAAHTQALSRVLLRILSPDGLITSPAKMASCAGSGCACL